MKHRLPGPKHPKYGIPTELWPMIMHRVMENNEPLKFICDGFVSMRPSLCCVRDIHAINFTLEGFVVDADGHDEGGSEKEVDIRYWHHL